MVAPGTREEEATVVEGAATVAAPRAEVEAVAETDNLPA